MKTLDQRGYAAQLRSENNDGSCHVRKVAASIWWARRFIKAAQSLCGRNITLQAGGTWECKDEGIDLSTDYASIDWGITNMPKGNTVRALVGDKWIRLTEAKGSYCVVEFDC